MFFSNPFFGVLNILVAVYVSSLINLLFTCDALVQVIPATATIDGALLDRKGSVIPHRVGNVTLKRRILGEADGFAGPRGGGYVIIFAEEKKSRWWAGHVRE